MKILGIESSCDETGVAIYDENKGVLAHALHSQVALHARFGGVVPELASRDHVNYLTPLVDAVLKEAGTGLNELDGIAYTAGPGLIGALLVGACFAKSLGFSLKIPTLGVHHLEAHVLVAQLDSPELAYPFIALLVSGGHTKLILVRGLGDYESLGDTLDDAVGEAFDKTAKLMGIPYPGGAQLAALADGCIKSPYTFPRPMTQKPGLDFSFSGLKTQALITWNASLKDNQAKAHIASAFQEAIIDTLIIKCLRAVKQTGCLSLVVAGGVGANSALRVKLKASMQALHGTVVFPRLEYCTDNGVMIAYTGFLHMARGEKDADLGVHVKARWPFCDDVG